jgi:hypothetical protein
MKKLILIGSYCDSPKKIKVLKTNLEILRKLDVHIFLYSPFLLEKEIVDLTDYFFLDNCFSTLDAEAQIYWKLGVYDGIPLKLNWVWIESVSGVFKQTKDLIKQSQFMDYDIFYFLLYDVIITTDLIHFIRSGEERFFPFKTFSAEDGERVIDCSTQIYSLKKEKIPKFDEIFTLDRLRKFDCAEFFFGYLASELGVPIRRDIEVQDHIHTFKNWAEDFYNYSPFDEFKILFMKKTQDKPTQMLIYDIQNPCSVFLRKNGEIHKFKIEGQTILGIEKDCVDFEIWHNGVIFDVIESGNKASMGWWERQSFSV